MPIFIGTNGDDRIDGEDGTTTSPAAATTTSSPVATPCG